MKCPNCGIHYDDGDKECPICGTRRPLFAQSTNPPAARTTAELARTTAGRKKRKPATPPPQTPYTAATTSTQKKASASKPKKKRNPVFIIILIIVLINVIPAIFGAFTSLANSIIESFDDPTHRAEDYYTTPLPDDVFDELTFPYPSVYDGPQGTLTLNEDCTYQVEADGLYETGTIFWWECESEDEYSDPYNFPFEQYRCLCLTFTPTEVERDPLLVPEDYPADDEDRFFSLYIDRETEEIWGVDDFEELFWFRNGEPVI